MQPRVKVVNRKRTKGTIIVVCIIEKVTVKNDGLVVRHNLRLPKSFLEETVVVLNVDYFEVRLAQEVHLLNEVGFVVLGDKNLVITKIKIGLNVVAILIYATPIALTRL